MTVKIKYAISIAAHGDWLKNLALVFFSQQEAAHGSFRTSVYVYYFFRNLVERKRIKVASRRNELRDKKNEKKKVADSFDSPRQHS